MSAKAAAGQQGDVVRPAGPPAARTPGTTPIPEALRLVDITHTYAGVAALQHVSLTVIPGEVA